MIMHSKGMASLPVLRAECEQAKSISLLYCHCPCMRVWAFCMLALIYSTAGQPARLVSSMTLLLAMNTVCAAMQP